MKVKIITKDKEIKIIDLKDYKGSCIVDGHRMGFDTDYIYCLRKDYGSSEERVGLIEKLYYEIQVMNKFSSDYSDTYCIDYDEAKTEEEAIIKAKELYVKDYLDVFVYKEIY